MSAPATSEPIAPGTVAAAPAPVAPITMTEASFMQLLEAAGAKAKADVEASPNVLVSHVVSTVAAANWPMVTVAVIAVSALVLHFPKLFSFL